MPWRGRQRRSGGGGGAPPLDLAEWSAGREKRLRGMGTSPWSVQARRDSTVILGSPGPQTPTQRASKCACWTPCGKIPGGLPARETMGIPAGKWASKLALKKGRPGSTLCYYTV